VGTTENRFFGCILYPLVLFGIGHTVSHDKAQGRLLTDAEGNQIGSQLSPCRAQSLARHSDIRLTMGVYTHIGLHDQSAAIELLPAPPEIKKTKKGSSNGKANGSSSAVPDLGAAWAKLSDKVKAEIVAMVNAAGKEGCVAT
jgi:hypothetical protein